jgi:hypothetical protein
MTCRQFPEVFDSCGVFPTSQFSPVSTPEFVEAFRIMAIPPAKRCRRCCLFAPLIKVSLLLCHTAWPETIDEDPVAVVSTSALVDPPHIDSSIDQGLPPVVVA